MPTAMSSTGSARLRVLVIDENEDACEACATLLRLYGHKSSSITSGCEAIEMATVGHWDLVLVSLTLKDISGDELAFKLRELHGPGLRIVALSNGQAPADLAKVQDELYDHFFLKPLSPPVLTALLSAAVRARKPPKEMLSMVRG